jgi:hypothetical protein
MALPWSTLVKAIPWSDVITQAPDIARAPASSGRKSARRKASESAAAAAVAGSGRCPDARLTALTAQVAELNARQQESAELLSALANQNAELVSAIAALRQRNRLLGAATGVTAVIALAALTLALTSPWHQLADFVAAQQRSVTGRTPPLQRPCQPPSVTAR